jgi:hypothetical protein
MRGVEGFRDIVDYVWQYSGGSISWTGNWRGGRGWIALGEWDHTPLEDRMKDTVLTIDRRFSAFIEAPNEERH